MTTPGMTIGNPTDGHPATFKQSIFLDSLNCINGTAGSETARWSQPGRNYQLIYPNQKDQRVAKYFENDLHVWPLSVYPKPVLEQLKLLYKK